MILHHVRCVRWSSRTVETSSAILHRLSFDLFVGNEHPERVLGLAAPTGLSPCSGDLRRDQWLRPQKAKDELLGGLRIAPTFATTNGGCSADTLLMAG